MKLTELQNVLGTLVSEVQDKDNSGDELESVITRAQTVASLAKQMINNADIIIRFDKMKSLSPETQARIESLI